MTTTRDGVEPKLLSDSELAIELSTIGATKRAKVRAHIAALNEKISAARRDSAVLIEYGDKLADWINLVAPALADLLSAYERRVRSDCASQQDLDAQPWRCAEFIAAESVLAGKPVNVVDVLVATSGEGAGV